MHTLTGLVNTRQPSNASHLMVHLGSQAERSSYIRQSSSSRHMAAEKARSSIKQLLGSPTIRANA